MLSEVVTEGFGVADGARDGRHRTSENGETGRTHHGVKSGPESKKHYRIETDRGTMIYVQWNKQAISSNFAYPLMGLEHE